MYSRELGPPAVRPDHSYMQFSGCAKKISQRQSADLDIFIDLHNSAANNGKEKKKIKGYKYQLRT